MSFFRAIAGATQSLANWPGAPEQLLFSNELSDPDGVFADSVFTVPSSWDGRVGGLVAGHFFENMNEKLLFIEKKSAIVGGVGVSARYWRIFPSANQSGGSIQAISADNIEMRATIGGPNLATNPSNALSSSEFSSGYINDYAFDGVNSQFWVSLNFSYGTQWIGYDFGSPVEINEFVWAKRPDSFGQAEAPTAGVVQSSDDGVTWTSRWTFSTPATWVVGAEFRTFNSVEGKGPWEAVCGAMYAEVRGVTISLSPIVFSEGDIYRVAYRGTGHTKPIDARNFFSGWVMPVSLTKLGMCRVEATTTTLMFSSGSLKILFQNEIVDSHGFFSSSEITVPAEFDGGFLLLNAGVDANWSISPHFQVSTDGGTTWSEVAYQGMDYEGNDGQVSSGPIAAVTGHKYRVMGQNYAYFGIAGLTEAMPATYFAGLFFKP